MDNKNTTKVSRKLTGIVTSDKMDKTCIVEVTRLKWHSKYHKQYKYSKKYSVHDSKNEAKIGNQVIFQECRPLSRNKKWRLIKIVK